MLVATIATFLFLYVSCAAPAVVDGQRLRSPRDDQGLFQAQDQRRQLKIGHLAFVGNDRQPSYAYPLQKCQGDCDSDDDCEMGLFCIERAGNESVPGCVGVSYAVEAVDICYDRGDEHIVFTKNSTLSRVGNNNVPKAAFPLQKVSGCPTCAHRFDGHVTLLTRLACSHCPCSVKETAMTTANVLVGSNASAATWRRRNRFQVAMA
jgi:hypothetical protein